VGINTYMQNQSSYELFLSFCCDIFKSLTDFALSGQLFGLVYIHRALPYADDIAPLGLAIYNSLLSMIVFQYILKNS